MLLLFITDTRSALEGDYRIRETVESVYTEKTYEVTIVFPQRTLREPCPIYWNTGDRLGTSSALVQTLIQRRKSRQQALFHQPTTKQRSAILSDFFNCLQFQPQSQARKVTLRSAVDIETDQNLSSRSSELLLNATPLLNLRAWFFPSFFVTVPLVLFSGHAPIVSL